MSNTIIKPKTREEWLHYRKSGIGSSEVATIVGLNPWETPYQLWRRKRGIDPPQPENFAMKAGHYLEDAVAMFWHDETGQDIIKSSAGDWLIRNNERPFLQVSPDRTYWLAGMAHNNTNKGILECKTTQKSVDADDLPKHWFCQLQYQLGVAELQCGSLAWLCSGREFGYKDLAFVPDFYGWLVEEVEKFWKDYIEGGLEPSAVSVQDVLLKYNRHIDGKSLEVSDEIFEAYKDLKDLKKQIASMEERKDELENRLKMVFNDAESITYGGDVLATWKAPKPSAKFDAALLKEKHPDIYNECVTEQQGARRFLLK